MNDPLLVAWLFSCCSLVLLFPSSKNLARAWSPKDVFLTFLRLLLKKSKRPILQSLRTFCLLSIELVRISRPSKVTEIWTRSTSESQPVEWKILYFLLIFGCRLKVSSGDSRALSALSFHVTWISSSYCFLDKQAKHCLFCIIFLWRTRENRPKRKVTRKSEPKKMTSCKTWTKETLNNLRLSDYMLLNITIKTNCIVTH